MLGKKPYWLYLVEKWRRFRSWTFLFWQHWRPPLQDHGYWKKIFILIFDEKRIFFWLLFNRFQNNAMNRMLCLLVWPKFFYLKKSPKSSLSNLARNQIKNFLFYISAWRLDGKANFYFAIENTVGPWFKWSSSLRKTSF